MRLVRQWENEYNEERPHRALKGKSPKEYLMEKLLSFGQINLVVEDVTASVAFYRKLGINVEEANAPGWARHHATAIMGNGFRLELDSKDFALQWNPGLKRDARRGGFVIFVMVPERSLVDDLFQKMKFSGSPVQKVPEDAFWGARYAIIEDPDGNSVGIMSPIDYTRRFTPPSPPSEGGSMAQN